jgi:hypothetical protein
MLNVTGCVYVLHSRIVGLDISRRAVKNAVLKLVKYLTIKYTAPTDRPLANQENKFITSAR